MPENEVETQEVVEPKTEENGEGAQLSYEELQAELAKVRREAAGRRVKNKEQEEELAGYRAWKESQMSELEKAQAKLAALDAERRDDYLDLAKTKYGLDDEDVEFLHGSTKQEILAAAEKLSNRIRKEKKEEGNGTGTGNPKSETNNNPNFFPGRRGTPVGTGSNLSGNDLLRAQLGARD